jgi:hypothetical protein
MLTGATIIGQKRIYFGKYDQDLSHHIKFLDFGGRS